MPLVLVSDRPRQFQFVADGGGEADIAAHEAEIDPHPGYATDTDVANLNGQFASYQPLSEKGQANGYVPLDANGKVISATYLNDAVAGSKGVLQLTGDLGGTANSPAVPGLATKEDSGVAASLVGAHEALSDPHPDYLKVAESDALYSVLGHTHPYKILGPYRATPAASALAATPRSIASVTVPDPGFDWLPLCFGDLELKTDVAATRPAVYIRLGSATGTSYARGVGVDGANVWATTRVTPFFPASPVLAGGQDRVFHMALANDYGGGWVQTTALASSMSVLVVPA